MNDEATEGVLPKTGLPGSGLATSSTTNFQPIWCFYE